MRVFSTLSSLLVIGALVASPLGAQAPTAGRPSLPRRFQAVAVQPRGPVGVSDTVATNVVARFLVEHDGWEPATSPVADTVGPRLALFVDGRLVARLSASDDRLVLEAGEHRYVQPATRELLLGYARLAGFVTGVATANDRPVP